MSDFENVIERAKAMTQTREQAEHWPGRCTVRNCTNTAGVAMTKNFGQDRWARCNDHLGCDDDGNPFGASSE